MGTAVTDIVLRISSKFAGGGLADLKAGIDMVQKYGGAIIDTVEKLDQFNEVMKKADRAMVDYADSAAQGQIDTLAIAKALNILSSSAPELKVTAEQLKTISVRAAQFATDTGQKATDVFERMTNGIARAESEALKQFGIKLKESAHMIDTQRQAVKELTEGYEDMEFEISTTTQRVDKFSNNWGTFWGTVWGDMTESTGLLGDALNAAANGIQAMTDAIVNSEAAVKERTIDYEQAAAAVNDLAKAQERIKLQQLQGAGAMGAPVSMMVQGDMLQLKKDLEQAKKQREEEFDKYLDELEGVGEQSYGYGDEFTKAMVDRLQTDQLAKYKAGGGWSANVGTDYAMSAAVKAYAAAVLNRPITSREQYERLLEKMPKGFAEAGVSASIPIESILGPIPIGMPGLAKAAPAGKYGDEGIIDAEIQKIQSIEEAKEQAHLQWMQRASEEGAEGSRLAEEYMRSLDGVYTMIEDREAYIAEVRELTMMEQMDAETGWQIAQLQFAEDFANVWTQALNQTSAGALAANAGFNLMRQTWGAVIDMAVYSERSIGSSMRTIVHEIGKALASEAAMRAAMEYVHAVAAAASKQYGAAAKHLAAGVAYTALAAGGIFAARATVPEAPAQTAGYTPSSSYENTGGAYSYGGQQVQGNQEVTVIVRSADGMWDTMIEKNDERARSGQSSFQRSAA